MTAEFHLPEMTPQAQVHGQYYNIQCSTVLSEAAISATFEAGPPTVGKLAEVSLPEKFQSNSAQLEYPSVSVVFAV